eukprot:1706013-Pyramimonas_sp.AAC.1
MADEEVDNETATRFCGQSSSSSSPSVPASTLTGGFGGGRGEESRPAGSEPSAMPVRASPGGSGGGRGE